MKRSLIFAAAFVILASGAAIWVGAVRNESNGTAVPPDSIGSNAVVVSLDTLKITVVYDNNPDRKGLAAEWGFSCYVEGAEKRILFDTGVEASVLLSNMDSLSIDPADIDIVVLSHIHGDHTGDVSTLLKANPDVTVFVPGSFPGGFKEETIRAGAELVEVRDPVEVCGGVYSTGQLGSIIKEQSLVLITDGGLIVITGCAHPGIVSVVNRAREVTGGDVLLAVGGFHLAGSGDAELRGIIDGLQEASVAQAGPCHCSGDNARRLFKEAYGEDYVAIGVGTVLHGRDLRQ